MPKAIFSIQGNKNEFSVFSDLPQEAIDAMRADGIEVGIVENMIPGWVAQAGLTRPWCLLQDVWNFRNPWRE